MMARLIEPPPAPRLIGIAAHHFAAVNRPEGAPDPAVDRALDESRRAVSEEHVHAARVVATRGDRRETRAAQFLVDTFQVQVEPDIPRRRADDRLVGGPGDGASRLPVRAGSLECGAVLRLTYLGSV
jgi:hypothetical protein